MKKLVINIKNAEALDHGIEKWKVLASGTNVWPDGEEFQQHECKLCDIAEGWDCGRCPVKLDTGEKSCRGTAYYDYESELEKVRGKRDAPNVKAEALFMVDYLIDLRSRCEVVAGARNHVVKEKK